VRGRVAGTGWLLALLGDTVTSDDRAEGTRSLMEGRRPAVGHPRRER
jgi:hypothetical protein